MTKPGLSTESLRELGFVSTISFGSKRSKQELNWRGAPLWWDGQRLWYQKNVLDLNTIEEVANFIKSLKIPRGRGKKPI